MCMYRQRHSQAMYDSWNRYRMLEQRLELNTIPKHHGFTHLLERSQISSRKDEHMFEALSSKIMSRTYARLFDWRFGTRCSFFGNPARWANDHCVGRLSAWKRVVTAMLHRDLKIRAQLCKILSVVIFISKFDFRKPASQLAS